MGEPVSGRVRAFLRRELPCWRAEGLIDAAAEEALAARYRLAEDEGAGIAVAALYVLAAALVGGGIISLVAWHWDDLPPVARLAILGGALVAAHVAGHRLSAGRPRLGHALLLLGTAIFGASIGLVAQIFQVSGPWYGAVGAWALGAFAAGMLLPSLPALCFSALLALFLWGPGFVGDHGRWGDALAWGVGGGFLALALQRRSRVLFVTAAVGLPVLLVVAAAELAHVSWAQFTPVLTVIAAAAGACTAFGALGGGERLGRLAEDAARLGRVALYGVGYLLSFDDVAGELVRQPLGPTRAWLTCALPLAVAGVVLLATARRQGGAGAPGPAAMQPARRAGPALVALAAIGSSVLLPAAALLREPLAVLVLAHLAVLTVAGLRCVEGLASRRRAPFWEGLTVAALLAVSRFFEIERLLWLKGAGFIACGLAVVAAAVAFERRLLPAGRAQPAEAPHA